MWCIYHCFCHKPYGEDVMSIHYDNHKMRQHLVECLEGAKMLPFPSTYEEKSIRFVKSETIDLFCHCRGPDSELMIQCDGCSEWYHVECGEINSAKVKKCVCSAEFARKRKDPVEMEAHNFTVIAIMLYSLSYDLCTHWQGRIHFGSQNYIGYLLAEWDKFWQPKFILGKKLLSDGMKIGSKKLS